MKQFVKFSFIILALLDCPGLQQVENWDSSSLPFSGSWNGEASCPSRRFHQYYQSSAKKTFLASLPSSCFSSFWDRQAHCPTVSFHQCQSWESLDAIGWVVRGRLFNKEKILLQWCVMCDVSIFNFWFPVFACLQGSLFFWNFEGNLRSDRPRKVTKLWRKPQYAQLEISVLTPSFCSNSKFETWS